MQQKYKKSMQKLSTETAGLQIQVQLFVLAKQTRGCFYITFYAFCIANHILSICTLYLWSSCIPPSAYIELIVQNAEQRTEVETTKNRHGGLTCHKDVPLETLSLHVVQHRVWIPLCFAGLCCYGHPSLLQVELYLRHPHRLTQTIHFGCVETTR